MIKFPSIEQFRNVVRNVQNRVRYDGKDEEGNPKFTNRPLPTLKFRGTVKLHGTNAAIVLNPDDTFTYQSRERELSLTSDNAGFMLAMEGKKDVVRQLFGDLAEALDSIDGVEYNAREPQTTIAVYGEWAGGNIQKGVAINGLEKFFAIFAVRVIDGEGNSQWADIKKLQHCCFPKEGIFHIMQFGSWEIDINFERPEESQNALSELTLKVEEACPAGKHFGQDGVGEGIVWTCVTPGWEDSEFWMKVKGEKHSASKVKTLAKVDTEAIRAVNDFVDSAVTENRLVQGAQYVVRELGKPFDMTSMGDFIRWVYGDVIKEETDTIVANQLDPKKLGGPISNKARVWFQAKFNEGADFSA